MVMSPIDIKIRRRARWLAILIIGVTSGMTVYFMNSMALVQNWPLSTPANYLCEGVALSLDQCGSHEWRGSATL